MNPALFTTATPQRLLFQRQVCPGVDTTPRPLHQRSDTVTVMCVLLLSARMDFTTACDKSTWSSATLDKALLSSVCQAESVHCYPLDCLAWRAMKLLCASSTKVMAQVTGTCFHALQVATDLQRLMFHIRTAVESILKSLSRVWRAPQQLGHPPAALDSM